jgi:integrase
MSEFVAHDHAERHHQGIGNELIQPPKPRLSQTLNDMLIVMLLTAQRRGEVCTMRWQDMDLATAWWTIPAETSKNADPHRVPLTRMVVEILEARARAKNADDRYVFSNHHHTCVYDRAKKAAAILCNGGVSFQFRAHDIRRTAASYMGEAGVDRFHIAHVLNHRSVTPRAQQLLLRNRRPPEIDIQGPEARRESFQCPIGEPADRPEWMILRHPRLQ